MKRHYFIELKHLKYFTMGLLIVFFLIISFLCLINRSETTQTVNNSSSLLEQITQDEKKIVIAYFDDAGNRAFAIDKNYSYVVKTINNLGQVILEEYYDEYDKPALQPTKNYALSYEYDDCGRVIKIAYLNEFLNPVMNSAGYATLEREYNEVDGTVEDTYFDQDGKQIPLSGKQYITLYYYENQNNPIEIHYLDKDKELIMTTYGYAIIKRSYSQEGALVSEMYFDAESNPVSLEHGQYGVRYDEGKITYLDKNGKSMFSIFKTLNDYSGLVIIIGMLLCLILLYSNQIIKWIIFVSYLLFVVSFTLIFRQSQNLGIKLILFDSYREFLSNPVIRKEVVENIWLFVPIGVAIHSIFRSAKKTVCGVLLSVSIELLQLIFHRGLFEIDDVLSNSIGLLIGMFIVILNSFILDIICKKKTYSNGIMN